MEQEDLQTLCLGANNPTQAAAKFEKCKEYSSTRSSAAFPKGAFTNYEEILLNIILLQDSYSVTLTTSFHIQACFEI